MTSWVLRLRLNECKYAMVQWVAVKDQDLHVDNINQKLIELDDGSPVSIVLAFLLCGFHNYFHTEEDQEAIQTDLLPPWCCAIDCIYPTASCIHLGDNL